MNISKSKVYYSVVGLPIGLLLWEYIAKKQISPYKPSALFDQLALYSVNCWYKIGGFAAYMSSFYTCINFKEVVEAAHDLVKPIFDIATSPYYFVKGYVNVSTLYEHPYLVVLGSVTILAVMMMLMCRWMGYKSIDDIMRDVESGSMRYFAAATRNTFPSGGVNCEVGK